ncbi:MAG TPA: DUF3667 domain-containing protein [Saprospiraceae bacterium]|nr:DUF3667 domain-containing protein [Saprospiraceae bacterium]
METTQEPTECKTCAAPLSGVYCSQCGQRLITRRITLRALFSELISLITNTDRGLLHTFWMLLKNPGKVVHDYIGGSTVQYASPLRYTLVGTALVTIVFIGMGVYDRQMAEMDSMMHQGHTPEAEMATNQIYALMRQYYQLISILFIPIFAWITRLLFRKSRLNYAEHLVTNAYFNTQATLLMTPFLLAVALTSVKMSSMMWVSMLASVAYYTLALRSAFDQKWLPAFLKSVLVYVLGTIIYTLVMGLLAIPISIYMVLKAKM